MGNRIKKTLKFKPHLIRPILDGAKAVTWRLFDDKDLRGGDYLEFINSETGETFAKAKIIVSHEKQIKNLTGADLEKNDYRDQAHVIEINRKYYGDAVSGETMVKIIEFKLKLDSESY